MTESDIFSTATASDESTGGFCEPYLLKTTMRARLYRVSRAGKYFVIKTTKDNSGAEYAMLRREYELSIGCDHPHIIHIYTFEEQTPVGAGIVMEYVEGCTMTEWLAENPAKESRRRIFGELLSAVGYMHHRGVLHNDLKPDNILIARADDSLKIIDFGLSDDDAHYLARTLGCTPLYASPELRERRLLDARSDIYSVGMIMGELFGNSYRRIAGRCTRPNPDMRYGDIGQLQTAWANRNRSWRRAAAAVIAAMILLPTALFVREHRQRTAAESAAVRREAELHVNIEQLQTRYGNMADSAARVRLDAERAAAAERHLFSALGNHSGKLYRHAADSIAASRYSQFAFLHLYNYATDFQRMRLAFCDTISDPQLKDAAASRLVRIGESDYQRLLDAVNLLPDYKAVCSDDEIRFYNDLLTNGHTWRPYAPER